MGVFPFIVGCGRSGTTLLRAMLDTHPDLAIFNESYFVSRTLERRKRYERGGSFDTPLFLEHVRTYSSFIRHGLSEERVRMSFEQDPPADYAEAVRRIFEIYAESKGKPLYGSKTGEHVWQLPVLAELFPEARFIHLIRDGRDVAQALVGAAWGPSSLGHAALFWDKRVRRGMKTGRPLGDRYCEVRYESIVADPETALRGLCDFLGLEFHDQMLRYYERGEAVIPRPPKWPRQHDGLLKPPTAGLRDWRRDMSSEDVALLERLAGRSLRALGYEEAPATLPRRTRALVRSRAARWRLANTAKRARRAPRRIQSRIGRGGVNALAA